MIGGIAGGKGRMGDIADRKRQHMELATSPSSQSTRSALWEDVVLLGSSVPDVALDDVDLATGFLGKELAAPFVIAGMTGGHDDATEINRNLALAADALGVAIGTGSQRAALLHPELAESYRVIREAAPGGLVIGNLGICQFVQQGDDPPFGRDQVVAAVEMIDADAMAIHLNVVEELIQTEGDRNTGGLAAALEQAVSWSPVPVVAKETGAGMTGETAAILAQTGVAALDVGGLGGTSFARIEALRAEAVGDARGVRLGATFGDWGLPTALSVIEAKSAGLPVVATGGIRNGLHAAKALALGATVVGIGGPLIQSAQAGLDAVIEELTMLIEELRMAMVLIDAADLPALRQHRPVLTGRVAEWLERRS